MRNISVKNIPDDLYENLKLKAKNNRRSINKEIIVCIENSVHGAKRNPELFLERSRELRKKTAANPISDEEFTNIKGDSRL